MKFDFIRFKWIIILNILANYQSEGDDVSVDIKDEELQKLIKYGYLPQRSQAIGEQQGIDRLVKAIKLFQKMAGLPQTGEINEATRGMMDAPRCGREDPQESTSRRKKRFVLQGTKWKDLRVTWALENSNNDGITDLQVRIAMQNSFKKWSDQTNLEFVELINRPINSAQIRVRFEVATHGDQYAFDGPGGTLAHAFYPHSNTGLAGDVHFDDDEVYTVEDTNDRSKRKFLWVAVHELGHSIGLEHSTLKGAVMYPWYQHFPGADFNLTFDDIQGVQSIYGSPVRTTVTTTTRKPDGTTTTTKRPVVTTTTKPYVCTQQTGAILLWHNLESYSFLNEDLYILHHHRNGVGLKEGPYRINDHFNTLQKVDAAFKRPRDNRFVFFHGDSFTVYTDKRLHQPARKIYNGFQGLDEGFSDVDASFIYSVNNERKLFIFKGEQYWRFTQLSNLDYSKDAGYPQLISLHWKGVPSSVDAVFEWSNGKTYFFKDDEYYRWNDRSNKVQFGYPLKNARSFLACRKPSSLFDSSTSTIHVSFSVGILCLIITFFF